MSHLNNRNLFSHNSGIWKPKIKVLTGWSHVFLFGFRVTTFFPHPQMNYPLCAHSCVSFYSYKDISPVELEPHLDGLNLNHLLKGPISN